MGKEAELRPGAEGQMRDGCIQWRGFGVSIPTRLGLRTSPMLCGAFAVLGGHRLPAPHIWGSLPPAPAWARGS